VQLENIGENDFQDLDARIEKISCYFCPESFFIPASLDSHVQREHPPVKQNSKNPFVAEQISCMFCKKMIRGKKAINIHLKLFHKHETVWCNFARCSSAFRSHYDLEEHLQTAHFAPGKNPVRCKKCKIWYRSKVCLSNHMKSQHSETEKLEKASYLMPCWFCAETFEKWVDLHHHVSKIHSNEAVKCRYPSCKTYFKTKEQMEEHFEEAHNVKCQFCHLIFTSACLWTAHLRSKHLNKKCKFFHCKFYADSEEELKKHVGEKHDAGKKNKSSACSFCDRILTSDLRKNMHVINHHSDKIFRCDKFNCSHFAESQDELEQHKKEAHSKVEKHQKTVVCLFCKKTIWNKASYVQHIRTWHSEEALRCKYKQCFTFFKSEIDLQNHYEEKHVGKYVYVCALCDYNCFSKISIQMHLQRQHLPKDKKCPHCSELFGSSSLLRLHIKFNHKRREKCPHCREIGTNLSRHVVTANCPACSQPFPCKKLLSDHKLGCKKVHKCLECGKSFEIASALKNHYNAKHKKSGEKKWKGYECKFCSTFFLDQKSLKQHQFEKHPTLVKIKNCDLCGDLFHRASVDYHMVHFHGVGGVECKVCDKRFMSQSQLSDHLRWNHDKDNPKFQFVECADCGIYVKKWAFTRHYRFYH